MNQYIVKKQFRHGMALRLPGETIELSESRAAILRECGLIETKPPESDKPEHQVEAGEKDEPKADNPSGKGTNKPRGSKTTSKGG